MDTSPAVLRYDTTPVKFQSPSKKSLFRGHRSIPLRRAQILGYPRRFRQLVSSRGRRAALALKPSFVSSCKDRRIASGLLTVALPSARATFGRLNALDWGAFASGERVDGSREYLPAE